MHKILEEKRYVFSKSGMKQLAVAQESDLPKPTIPLRTAALRTLSDNVHKDAPILMNASYWGVIVKEELLL